ncbi:MAG TPA: hypothetical protein PKL97_01715 [Candidatus Omnitrophota bacterium]|nr:hypothetical protein [Candidatus Omnitrophota bacterium]
MGVHDALLVYDFYFDAPVFLAYHEEENRLKQPPGRIPKGSSFSCKG